MLIALFAASAAELGTRRSVKKDFQAGWLLRGVTCIDLTTLDGGDTPGNVARMCAKVCTKAYCLVAANLQCCWMTVIILQEHATYALDNGNDFM